MEYAAVGLAVIGVGAGLAFRWQVLLPIIILLPLVAIVLSASRGLSYTDMLIVIFIAEVILQGGYFAGLLIRHIAAAGLRSLPQASSYFRGRSNSEGDGTGQQHNAPGAGARKAR